MRSPTIGQLDAAGRRKYRIRLVILYFVGIWLLWSFRDHIMTHEWRATQGVVIETGVSHLSGGADASTFSTTCLQVYYRYSVLGQNHVGKRFRISNNCLSPNQETVARFPPGRILRVWYDVDDPAFSVLDPTFQWSGVGVWCMFVGLIALAHGVLILFAKNKADPDHDET